MNEGTPTVQRPRVYRLSGDDPRPSVALAVLGTMISEAETDVFPDWGRIDGLKDARDRVAAAEKEAAR